MIIITVKTKEKKAIFRVIEDGYEGVHEVDIYGSVTDFWYSVFSRYYEDDGYTQFVDIHVLNENGKWKVSSYPVYYGKWGLETDYSGKKYKKIELIIHE